ncbi:MAG: macro domain-containing protein [Herpetosiphonaceae bacterium]|nr:macro domain-containing protein [Herpetosiphonaceae bacterium]
MDLEFQIPLLDTTVHIGHADLTTIDADVLVCPGNPYLSLSGGVALEIRNKAGDAIILDLRKHPLPAQIGTVIVTGAGQLPARYIFHAISGGFLDKVPQDVLTAHLVREVLTLGTQLNVQHIALPLIGTGIAGGNKAIALDCILDTALHYIANNATSIRHISVVIFVGLTSEQIAPKVQARNEAIQALQTIMRKLHDLRNSLPDDADLQAMLLQRLYGYDAQLRQRFYFPAMDSPKDFSSAGADSPQQRKEAIAQVTELLQTLATELNHETEIQKIEQFRLQEQEKHAATKGLDTAPHITLEITELQRRMEERRHKIEQLRTQRDAYASELKKLS